MNETNESYSSRKAETTRVKSRKKQAKKTVGITLPPYLIKKARKHNLNISRITEQALISILEYLAHQNQVKTSKYLPNKSSFPKETRAGSLAWLGRSLYEAEVAGSSPARPTTHFHLTFISN